MRIVSFGSCLSRYTANQYLQLFGGELVSSIYHNRSDAFVGRFIERSWPEVDVDALARLLRPEAEEAALILRNQGRAAMGRHHLNRGTPLFEVLEEQAADVVLLDNYMDVAARLVERGGDARTRVFLRPADLRPDVSGWSVGDVLDPAVGAQCMQRIVAHFRERLPKAAIAFFCFPHNTYVEAQERVARSIRYEAELQLDDALVVPCLTVPDRFQTVQRQHFKPPQYAAYAGMLYQYLNSRGVPR